MAKQEKRAVHGIVLLDKPKGITSNRALQIVKRLYNARKAGHTGSLDPLASGLLPLCLGEATKVAGYLLDSDKTYLVTIQLGTQTTTGDVEGDIKATAAIPSSLSEALLHTVLKSFEGESEQCPPMYSAIKQNGQPLYKLARQGIEVERAARKITLYECGLLSFDADTLNLRVKCSKGTYIRVLAEDIATALGTVGHVLSLRRIAAGPYDATQMVTLPQLEKLAANHDTERLDKCLSPIEKALDHWPKIHLDKTLVTSIRQGVAVDVPEPITQGWVRLFDCKHKFLGIGLAQEGGRVAPKRLIST